MPKNKKNKAKNKKKGPYNKNKVYAKEKEETEYIKAEKEEIFKKEKIDHEEINELLNKFEEDYFSLEEDYLEINENKKPKYIIKKTFPKEIKEEYIKNLSEEDTNIIEKIQKNENIIKAKECSFNFIKNKNIYDSIIQIEYIKKEKEEKNIDDYDSELEDKLSKSNPSLNDLDNLETNLKYKIKDTKLEHLNEEEKKRYLINRNFVEFRKRSSLKKPDLWWPVHVKYAGKKYYIMTKLNCCESYNINIISYYCNNHLLNTDNKKNKFHNKPCNGKIEYNRINDNFYLVQKHNDICGELRHTIYDNVASISKNINNYQNFKSQLIQYLNTHPLLIYKDFKNYGNTIYEKSKKDFNLKENFYKNLYYPWRKNNKLFSWYCIYDNIRTKDNQIYLKDVCTSYLYKSDNKNMYWHNHIIWGSNYHFNNMALSHHLYIDGTFLTTKEFYQMIIIMYYHDTIEKKIPGCYILINSKEKNSYIMILKVFKRLLTKETSRQIKIFTISTDFE